jgi:hypothetical protein
MTRYAFGQRLECNGQVLFQITFKFVCIHFKCLAPVCRGGARGAVAARPAAHAQPIRERQRAHVSYANSMRLLARVGQAAEMHWFLPAFDLTGGIALLELT